MVSLGSHGRRAQGEPEKVTDHDLWHLGSCTKAMTATLVAVHVEDGLLGWDTTLGEIFDDVPMHADYASVPITWILSHRAGTLTNLLNEPDLFGLLGEDREITEVRAEFVTGALSVEPEFTPGTDWAYSNTGFILAGAALERLTGSSWEPLIPERLFAPLEMDSCGFGPPGDPTTVDQPWGHGPTGVPYEPNNLADNPPGLGPAGTVHCDMADWSKFAADQVAGARGDQALLTPESYTTLHTPLGDDYALGWGVFDREWSGGTALSHSGSNTLWFSQVWLAPELDSAYLVVTNIAASDTPYAVDAAITELIVDGEGR